MSDAVTGLATRDEFHARLERIIQSKPIDSTRSAFLLVDIDRFAALNQALGFVIGDAVLAQVARELSALLRSADEIARHDGARFAIWMADAGQKIEVLQLAERLISLREVNIAGHGVVELSLSVACVFFPDHGTNLVQLMRHAQDALLQAKASGGACVRVASAGSELDRKTNPWALQNTLVQAVAEDKLALAYQPLVDLKTQIMVGVEALLRTRIQELASSSTEAIMDAAESLPVIAQLTEWGISRACRDHKSWRGARTDIGISVNLPPAILLDRNLIGWVQAALASTGMDTKELTLEITERSFAQHPGLALQRLQELRALGCSIAIDDFGVGYAALGQLVRLPIDKIKLDRSLTFDATTNKKSEILVRHLIALGRDLGLEVLAEGIETKEQVQLLVDAGCHFAQGYYFARPITAGGIALLLDKRLPI